jgi:membrane-associated phospholipid phosphatase
VTLAASHEHPLLYNRRRDVVAAVIISLATAALFLLVGLHATHGVVQRIDDRFLRTMVAHRVSWVTSVAKVFNILGTLAVTLPIRIVVAGYLALRRRWWHFAAFVLAIVTSEILIGTLKNLYGRPRPPRALSLVGTSGASFPSGHAVAATVTVVATVLALLPAGPHRWAWGTAAALFSFVMALSRAYLAAHWLSDAVAGTFLGASCAIWAAVVVQAIRDRREGGVERTEAASHENDRGDPSATLPTDGR